MLVKSSPSSSRISLSALSTIPSAVACPFLSRNESASEPEFAPTRIGILASFAARTTCSIFIGSVMFPGFNRSLSTPASIDARAKR